MGKAARLKAQKMRQRDPHRTPHTMPRPGELLETAFIPGLTIRTDPAIEKMQRQTHDGLIDLLGPRRRSGIRLRIVHGPREIRRILQLMYGDDIEKWTLVVDGFFPFLDQHGDQSVMVVAECEAVRW